MPSHLTRVVFRQLLANEPIAHSGCLRRSIRQQYVVSRQSLPRSQRRQFFNLFSPPDRQAVEANIDPGLERLMQYAKMERLNARLPPVDHVAGGFADFFDHRSKTREPIEDVQAQYALQALSYLRKEGHAATMPASIFRTAMTTLAIPSHQASPAHRELALNLYDCVCDRTSPENGRSYNWALPALLDVLCRINSTALARDYLVVSKGEQNQLSDQESDSERASKRRSQLWNKILRGFKDERNASELRQTLQLMEQHGVSTNSSPIAITMAEFSVSIDDAEAARKWYEHGKQIDLKNPPSTTPSLQARKEELQEMLLHLCMRTSQIEFGQSIIRDIMMASPSKRQWDFIFEWAAGTGKGVDEIDRMMGVMEKANLDIAIEDEHLLPDVESINRLVELAISKKDPYMAERFIALGKKRDIEPNARTLVLQIGYRLSVNDVDGALVAYKHLQAQDVSDDQDVLTVNDLICAMCTNGRQDFDSIMNVAADLSDRRARFEPATVSALSVLHLSRNESDDVLDLLNTHIFKFSNAEKASVRNTLITYCLNPSSTVAQAWDAYSILKQMFDETSREERTQIMNDFFRRRRADMAVHIFNHMRTHTRPDTISTVDTYVSCFVGIARLKDLESLEVVHNQMKLDYSIEPNTRLLNSLILAFTACEAPRRALSFWDEIVSSREGPTVNSIHLAFRACEASPWGDQKARDIWARLNKTGLELDQAMWASYAAGLAGNGDIQSSVTALEEAHAEGKVEVNALIIGSVFNAAPGQAKKADVESWAKSRFPTIWDELQSIASRTKQPGTTGVRNFRIDRHIDP